MGGYARYVWPAYAIAGAVLFGNFILAQQQRRKTIRTIAAWLQRRKQ